MKMYGPIDYVAIAFAGTEFKGDIIKELTKVVDQKLIRVLDLVFIMKDKDGKVEGFELRNMPPEIAKAFKPLTNNMEAVLSESDAEAIGESLENNTAAGILVFEHLWAKGFKKAVLDAKGFLIAEGRVHPKDAQQAANAQSMQRAA